MAKTVKFLKFDHDIKDIHVKNEFVGSSSSQRHITDLD